MSVDLSGNSYLHSNDLVLSSRSANACPHWPPTTHCHGIHQAGQEAPQGVRGGLDDAGHEARDARQEAYVEGREKCPRGNSQEHDLRRMPESELSGDSGPYSAE